MTPGRRAQIQRMRGHHPHGEPVVRATPTTLTLLPCLWTFLSNAFNSVDRVSGLRAVRRVCPEPLGLIHAMTSCPTFSSCLTPHSLGLFPYPCFALPSETRSPQIRRASTFPVSTTKAGSSLVGPRLFPIFCRVCHARSDSMASRHPWTHRR